MTKSWRPEGWDNPYIPTTMRYGGKLITDYHIVYEAGADAILGILRNNQLSPFDPTVMQANFKGRIVIIPDDEEGIYD